MSQVRMLKPQVLLHVMQMKWKMNPRSILNVVWLGVGESTVKTVLAKCSNNANSKSSFLTSVGGFITPIPESPLCIIMLVLRPFQHHLYTM